LRNLETKSKPTSSIEVKQEITSYSKIWTKFMETTKKTDLLLEL